MKTLLPLVLYASLTAAQAPQVVSVVPLFDEGFRFADGTLSPDLRNWAYLDQTSLYVRELSSGRTTKVLTAPTRMSGELSYAPDGKSIYFLRRDDVLTWGEAVFRVTLEDGKQVKIVDRVIGALRASPDGKRIAFLQRTANGIAWMTAAVDGKDLRKLADWRKGASNPSLAWSPDSTRVATLSRTGSRSFLSVDTVATGVSKELRYEGERLYEVVWPAHGGGLLLLGQDGKNLSNAMNQRGAIWHYALPSGTVTRVTNDSSLYRDLRDAGDGLTFSALRAEGTFWRSMVSAFGLPDPRMMLPPDIVMIRLRY